MPLIFYNEEYQTLLESICSLSRLFSDSNIPYLSYRVAENIFQKSFRARNLARKDSSFDAMHSDFGVGLKTFQLKHQNSLEKVAEFNLISSHLRDLSGKRLAVEISKARNERITTAINTYQTVNQIYHCVGRNEGQLIIFETPYLTVNLDQIKMLRSNFDNIIKFEDGSNEYSYNISKSTLYMRFDHNDQFRTIDIKIIDDPYDILERIFTLIEDENQAKETEYIVLPLYSTRYKDRRVPKKSGLNQWNAGGRNRDSDEVYIPIPIYIHQNYPNFFPPRDIHFNLILPHGETLVAKVCQDNSKALMTTPNTALSNWLLRNILNLEEGELATRQKLDYLGFDSVKVTKFNDNTFYIDILSSHSYENFKIGNQSLSDT